MLPKVNRLCKLMTKFLLATINHLISKFNLQTSEINEGIKQRNYSDNRSRVELVRIPTLMMITEMKKREVEGLVGEETIVISITSNELRMSRRSMAP